MRFVRGLGLCLVVGSLLASDAHADIVVLDDGARLVGLVRTVGSQTQITTAAGVLTVPNAQVMAVERTETPLRTYEQRLAELNFDDAQDHLRLARWAGEQGLDAQAQARFRHVLDVRPSDAEAHRGLGHVQHDGQWMTEAEQARAMGKVRYAGTWVTPEVAEAERKVWSERVAARADEARAAAARAKRTERAEVRDVAGSDETWATPFGFNPWLAPLGTYPWPTQTPVYAWRLRTPRSRPGLRVLGPLTRPTIVVPTPRAVLGSPQRTR